MPSQEVIIATTKKWLVESVIKYQFCPYAKQPHKNDEIGYHVYLGDDAVELLEMLACCCLTLDGVIEPPVPRDALLETSLLIIGGDTGNAGYLSDFYDYLDVVEIANTFLASPRRFVSHFSRDFRQHYHQHIPEAWDEKYQLASFHPDYQFEGSTADDSSNYTNRSPYPVLHIIRNETIEKARLNDTIAAKIVENNITTLETMSEKSFKVLQALGRSEKS